MPSPINDTDLFLIEEPSGASKKITAQKLRDNLAAGTYDNHKLLVNRSDYSSRWVHAQNMQSSVTPSDWMLVERGGTSYKVSGQQIQDYFLRPRQPTAPVQLKTSILDTGFSQPQILTLASDNHVGDLTNGDSIVMTDDGCNVTSYIPTSSTITNVADSGGNTKLTVADNVDVKYFKPGDVVQDTTDWTLVTESQGTTAYYDMAYGNGQYVAVGFPGTGKFPAIYATDPAGPWNYVNLGSGLTNTFEAVIFAEGYFLTLARTTKTAGTTAKYATDATGPWSNSPINQRNWRDIAYGDGKFVAVSGGQVAYSSPPFASWSEINLAQSVHAITYGDGKFVAVDELRQGTLLWATDPAGPWNSVTIPARGYKAITYGNGYFVAVATQSNQVLWATDPAGPWQSATIQEDATDNHNPWSDICYDGGRFYITQSYNTSGKGYVATAVDPRTWLLTEAPNQGWEAVVHGGGYTVCASTTSSQRIMYNKSATVVSRDVNEPSITVDGGRWKGSDNSGDAAGETSVTGPSKSGTGNFGGSSGNDITVNNSNHDWIDGDNREGRLFYLKNRNSRIGLAKLREKAIATAQAWTADTGYASEAVIEHNGRYWLALSSNYNNSPDSEDQRDWFDLGAI